MGQKEKSWSRIIRVRKERLGQYKTRRGRAWDEWEKAARSRLISTSCFTTQIIASNEDNNRVNFIMKTNRNRECCTEWMEWMSHRKQKETKQQPGTAGPGNMLGCCLVSLHFLCDIHFIHPVQRAKWMLQNPSKFSPTGSVIKFEIIHYVAGYEGPSSHAKESSGWKF